MDADLFVRLIGEADAASRDDAREFARELQAESPLALGLALAGSAVFVVLTWSAHAAAAIAAQLRPGRPARERELAREQHHGVA